MVGAHQRWGPARCALSLRPRKPVTFYGNFDEPLSDNLSRAVQLSLAVGHACVTCLCCYLVGSISRPLRKPQQSIARAYVRTACVRRARCGALTPPSSSLTHRVAARDTGICKVHAAAAGAMRTRMVNLLFKAMWHVAWLWRQQPGARTRMARPPPQHCCAQQKAPAASTLAPKAGPLPLGSTAASF